MFARNVKAIDGEIIVQSATVGTLGLLGGDQGRCDVTNRLR